MMTNRRLPVLAGMIILSTPAWAVESVAAQPSSALSMGLIALVLTATFAFIAFETFHKSLVALLGAVVAVFLALVLGIFPASVGYGAVHEFIAHDLGVIGVIVGTSILVEISAQSGLFHFIAIKLVKTTGGRPGYLLPTVLAATIGFVTFLTIAPGVLIMTSLVLVITRSLGDRPVPYIMAVALGANSGALMTFASGIPTLLIGTSAGIPYVHFLLVSTPLAILSAIPAYVIIRMAYRRDLAESEDEDELHERRRKVAQFDEWSLVKDRRIFYRCAGILVLTILGFAFAQTLGVGLDFIAFTGATAALLFSGFDPEEAIRKVKWPIILFFVGLFVLIGTLRATGLLEVMAGQIIDIAGSSVLLAILILVPFVFITAGIVDNIPVAATMIPIVKGMIAGGFPAEPLWWSLIAACNLGGNSTPVGSLASVIALHALEKERGITVGWGEYLRIGGLLVAIQIPLVIIYLEIYRYFDLFPDL